MRISDWSSDVCSSDLLVSGKCRAEFERQIFKKRAFVDRDDHLAALHLGQRAQERGELGDMKLVHRLDRVIKHERAEERRLGTECDRTCSSRRWPYTSKKKK